MNQGHHGPATSSKGAPPTNAREALQWFVNNYGLYLGSTRGLFISDWAEEKESTLESAVISLKSRGFHPFTVTGDTLFKQADYLWKESRAHTQFGRPLASKLELEMGGSDIVIVDNLEAPENSRELWYLWSHLLYPRTMAGKPTIITTPLSFTEFVRYGESCPDPDFCGKAINWEKLLWLIEASMITLDCLKFGKEHNLPPMLKAEQALYVALKERNLEVVPQHVLGDFMLDFALIDKERRLNIECDHISTLGSSEAQRQEAQRNLMLFADGWQVLKFTTGEALGNVVGCVDVVDDVWRSGRKRGSTGRLLAGNVVPPIPDLPVDDEVQMDAITYGGGPAVICGGAGTGKTTCVVQRVAYLVGQGVSAENILVVTHATDTQRALKRSMEAALEKQVAQKLNVCSWQDLGLKILKENLSAIHRKPPLKIEPGPQKIVQRLLAKTKKEIDPAKLELSVDLDEFYIAAVISMYKAHLISPKQAKDDASNYGEEIIAKIYQQLEDQLQKANRIDRDDVICMAVQVLLESAELRARYQRQFDFVLIDEYQDITVAQDMLGRLLAAPQDNLFLAGDEDETICEGKNACAELFTEISLRLPHARCFTLERNWRSHPAIVDHARQLISLLQKRRVQKEYHSAWGQTVASAIVGPAALVDEYDEANWVASEIQLLADSGRNYGDIAILFRHHVYATILEEALDQRGVKFQASNPITNFIPDEVEDMMAFLKLVLDPDGPRARESFERVCQLRIKEIDPKLSGTIASFAEANNLSYLKAVEIYSEATSDQACRDLEQLVRIIRTMHQDKLPPTEAISLVRRTQRLNEYYRTVKVPAGVNYEPLKKLTQLEEESRNFKTISDFVKGMGNQKQSGTGMSDSGVQVLPMLDSKGLEFPIVFIVGMAEGIFPAQTAIDLEEERRICYVAFTRAKELLYVSYPQQFSGALLYPSHFLVDARLMAALPTPMPSMPTAHQQYAPAAAAFVEPQPQMYAEPQPQMYAEPQPQMYAEPQPQMYAEPQPQMYAEPQPQMYTELPAPVHFEPPPAVYTEPESPTYSEPVHAEPDWGLEPLPVAVQAEAVPVPEQPAAVVEEPVSIIDRHAISAASAAAALDYFVPEPVLSPPSEEAQSAETVPAIVMPDVPVVEQVADPVIKPPSTGRAARAGRKKGQVEVPIPVGMPEPVQEPAEPTIPLASPTPADVPSTSGLSPAATIDLVAASVAAAESLLMPGSVPPVAAAGETPPAPAPVVAAGERPLVPAEELPVAAPLPEPIASPAEAPTAPHVSPEPFYKPVPNAPLPVPAQFPTMPIAPAASAAPSAADPFSAPVDPFQVYSGDAQPHRSVMPHLPRSKGGAAANMPAAEPATAQPQPVEQPYSPQPTAAPQPSFPSQPAEQPQGPQPTSAPRPPFPTQPALPAQPLQPPTQPPPPFPPQPVAPVQPVQPMSPARPPMPHLPVHHEAAAQAPAAFSMPAVPQSLENQLRQNMLQGQPASPVAPPSQPSFQAEPQAQPPVPMQRPPQPQPAAPQPPAQTHQQPYQQPVQQAPHQQHQVGHQPYQQMPQAQHQQQQQQAYQQAYQQPHQQQQHLPPQPYPVHMQPEVQHEATAGQPLCPSCHAPLEANARFCSECGYSLPQRIPACPTCSAPLETTAKFCGECGVELSGPVAGDSNQISANMVRMQDLKDKQHGWANKIWKMLEN